MRRVALAACALALLALLALRLHVEHRFAVVPEPRDEVTVVDAAPLAAHVRRLLEGRGSDAGSAVVPLGDARTALLARIGLVDLAASRIDAQYYLFEDDEAGHALLAALSEAAGRGVRVRLLLDDIALVERAPALARFAAAHENLELRVFNPTWLRRLRPIEYLARFPRATRRMHNKSLTVDGVTSVVGGRNVSNEYFGVDSESVFEDLDVLALGDVATRAATAFERYWRSGLAVDIGRVVAPADDEGYRDWLAVRAEALAGYRTEVDEREDLAVGRLVNGTVESVVTEAALLVDDPRKVLGGLGGSGAVAEGVLELFGAAEKALVIASPYLIPGADGMRVFETLRRRGVEVTILTNSLAANDVALVHAAYRDYRRPLLELGVRLYEFRPNASPTRGRRALADAFFGSRRTTLHAKSFVVDGARSFVGSFNIDPRSTSHNTEMGLVVESEELGRRLSERLDRTLDARAWEVVLVEDGALEWRGRDAEGRAVARGREPDTTRLQRALVYIASWLPIDWLL